MQYCQRHACDLPIGLVARKLNGKTGRSKEVQNPTKCCFLQGCLKMSHRMNEVKRRETKQPDSSTCEENIRRTETWLRNLKTTPTAAALSLPHYVRAAEAQIFPESCVSMLTEYWCFMVELWVTALLHGNQSNTHSLRSEPQDRCWKHPSQYSLLRSKSHFSASTVRGIPRATICTSKADV